MFRYALALLALAGGCVAQDRVPSPKGDRLAHYTLCDARAPCIPEVVITRNDASEVRRFQVRNEDGPCLSILNIHWAGENAIGAVCHANPSMNDYFEVDIATGKPFQHYRGYGFARSPDYAKVAHVGWIIHFAPPWVKSEYLQVGNTILYPLPAGMKPVEQKPLEMAPEVVTRKGLVYAGVHTFGGKFVWSPDSRHIGFTDCLVDYRLRDDSQEAFSEGGTEENLRCFAVVVGLDGEFRNTPIAAASAKTMVLEWTDTSTMLATYDGGSVTVNAP